MNILVPDSWLREYLKTKATPIQIKEYLSLCGPSVERIHGQGKNTVYDIEITGNRPDAMSVIGIAREAAAILPRFGLATTLVGDPYQQKTAKPAASATLRLAVNTDAILNPRWTSVVFDNVAIGPSPAWLTHWLELAGLRSLNNVIDITNFLMRSYGQPAHIFDYDRISKHHMVLRESRKGEKLITLDGKVHKLPGGDIVIEDGAGNLIDLCGIMGGENSSVKPTTRRVILFLQTYDPTHIRRTSMALAHRTEASSLFEKGTDPELVWPVFLQGVKLMGELTGGKIASRITDIYPYPYKKSTVSAHRQKVNSYIGASLPDQETHSILSSLGFDTKLTKEAVSVTVPSWRRDITIGVDIIEEIARIFGYHNIADRLPEGEPPVVFPNAEFGWEEEIKVRLRDWGYTELYTYSMISETAMNVFGLDKTKTYTIANPLSGDWVYMRPTLWPSLLAAFKENLDYKEDLRLFELSKIYHWRPHDLPDEYSILLVGWTGDRFFEAKGLAEAIFALFGIPFPGPDSDQPLNWYDETKRLALGRYGSVGVINETLQAAMGIKKQITLLDLLIPELIRDAKPIRRFHPIPKYPPVVEDLSFIVPPAFAVGPLIRALRFAHPKVAGVTLLDVHENTRTFHITYLDPKRNLTNEEIIPIREKLIELTRRKFGVTLKTS